MWYVSLNPSTTTFQLASTGVTTVQRKSSSPTRDVVGDGLEVLAQRHRRRVEVDEQRAPGVDPRLDQRQLVVVQLAERLAARHLT